MRQYVFWALIVLSLPYILKRPFWGVVLYTAFNIIRPEMLFWGGTQGSKVFIILISIAAAATFLKSVSASQKPTLLSTPFLPVHFVISMILEVLRQSHLRLILWLYIALVVSIELSAYDIPRAYYFANEIFKVLVLCFLITVNINDFNEVKKYENIVLLVFVLLGIWGIEQYFRGNYRLEGLGGNAFPDSNGVAAMFVLFLPLALNKLITPVRKIDLYAGLVASFVIIALIICTFSRGGLLGMVACITVFTLRSRHKLKIAMMVLVLLLLVSPFLTENYLARIRTMNNPETAGYTGRARLILWKAGIMIFRDNPLFGTGFMTFPYAKMQYKGEFDYLDRDFQEHVFITRGSRVSHNTYIQVISDGGLFLAIPFFMFLFGSFWRNWYVSKKYFIEERNKEMLNLLAAIDSGIIGYGVSIFFIDAITGIFLYIQITVCAIIRNIIIKNNQKVFSSLHNSNGLQVHR